MSFRTQWSVTQDDGFNSMFRASYASVLSYCLRRAPRPAAEDAVAEVFSIAWRRRRQIPVDPVPWLLGVARRVLANQTRAERRRTRLVGRIGAGKADRRPDPAVVPTVDAALARLSATDAEIVRLAYWDELTHQEIGQVVGLSANAIGVRLHRARARLKAELIEPSTEETAPCDSPT